MKVEINQPYIKQMEPAGYPKEIIHAYKQGGTPWLDGRHTVFCQVIDGMDVVDEIAKVKKNKMDKPLEDVVINTIDTDGQFWKTNKIRAIVDYFDNSSYFSFSSFPLKGQ